jgi:RNA polymerase sigma-70 factor (ECF subfamily)
MLTLAIDNMSVTTRVNVIDAVQAVQPRSTSAPARAQTLSEIERERAVVRAVLAGNANAFQSLVEAHQSGAYNLALRMLGNEREAEDAAQDAFVHAYARLASYKPEWRFKTWIMTITSNVCIDRLRRRKIEPMSFTDYAQGSNFQTAETEGEAEIEFVSRDPQPDAEVVRKQQRAAVQVMLSELPLEDRAMVVMFYWQDMSYEDIARAMKTTVSAVKSRLFRARRAMAQSRWAERAPFNRCNRCGSLSAIRAAVQHVLYPVERGQVTRHRNARRKRFRTSVL